MILHEAGNQIDIVFPSESTGYKVESKTEYRSCQYEFYGQPGIETYLFILSDKPIDEMEQFRKLSGDWWKCGELNPYQRKLLKTLSRRVKEEGQKIDLEIMGSKSFAKVPGKSFPGIIWFQVYLEN